MTKTENLHLNLLEDKDSSTAAAINANMENLDEWLTILSECSFDEFCDLWRTMDAKADTSALAELKATVQSAASQLAALGTTGHNIRAYTTTYSGNNAGNGATIHFPASFHPVMLLITASSTSGSSPNVGIAVGDCSQLSTSNNGSARLSWSTGQVTVNGSNPSSGLYMAVTYYVLLLGYDA